jgi:hypothetical protein
LNQKLEFGVWGGDANGIDLGRREYSFLQERVEQSREIHGAYGGGRPGGRADI